MLSPPSLQTHSRRRLRRCPTTPLNHTSVLVYPIPHPDHFVAGYLVFQRGELKDKGFCAGHDRSLTAADAAIKGLQATAVVPSLHTDVFVPNRNLHRPLFFTCETPSPPVSSHFHLHPPRAPLPRPRNFCGDLPSKGPAPEEELPS